jgi:hypothetical protein
MMQSDWKQKALCLKHPESGIWFSYKKDEVDRAKSICRKCPVRTECFLSMWNTGDFYGIYGGISEFDYLMATWKEVKSEKENNRTRSNRVLQGIMQEIR